ncbi:macro domain-containing protein [Salimicrobium salexigens]|uniref:O-acetyl-ADP-ribose deacetylase (Regulator of RNase III), contains Macro domain n=1 Tax=Salimicrobium salexigens TaxID=908941 RepID=A0ABY1KVK9_9BACI|nr:macro domain-containing protein [Salimicrobium salexigens]SIS69677.1 O-acetyl-ADP-ribose deacetylase (regulator of RNase III), contains Macro domain [Salimicrobium salexigens]
MKIEVVKGDIADQSDMEAVVNAANKELRSGGGVAGALHKKAGPGLQKAGERYAPLQPGEAVVTEGFGLPNDFVIHTLGPVYGTDEPAEELLGSCYGESLERAREHKITSVAFPLISTGAFGYPLEAGIDTALEVVESYFPRPGSLQIVRFVLFSDEQYETFKRKYESRS